MLRIEAYIRPSSLPVFHAALVAVDNARTSGTSLLSDCFDVVEPTPLFKLDIVDGSRPRRRHNHEVAR